ncbi:hypothetical protein [Cohnella caldifontis]|uniref:hypothetical protein n=1 Tax=Cohnella caldifontis TaxID=3027471 RepID=UPI0023ECD0C9|nr:hypothetical protein [Cohnella sp. YIM B05605]
MRLSTSNSKTKRLRLSLGFLGFLVMFAAVEIYVFRDLSFYGMEYRSSVGQLEELEYSFQHSRPEGIRTAIFGDSQSKDALRPELLAQTAKLDPSSIFNFSVSGAKAYDIYQTYLKYVDRLPNLKEAIIVVNEHQLNSYNISNDPIFRYYAGLQDRIQALNKDNYGELLLGWVSKGFDMRSIWTKIVQSCFKGTLPKPLSSVWKPGGIRAETMMEPNGLTLEYAQDTASRWFDHYTLRGLQTDSFEALLRDLRERGVRVVVLQIPRSSLFEQAVKQKYAAQQRDYFDQISSIAREFGVEFHVMTNEGLTLKDHFRDTNHVQPKGAIIVSREVALQWLM